MTLGGWTALALPSVRRPHVEAALRDLGSDWTTASHVTATTTLARAIRSRGQVGLPLATLLDLVLMPSLQGGMALPLDGFPGPEALGGRRWRASRTWAHSPAGRARPPAAASSPGSGSTTPCVASSVRRSHGRVGRALVASRRALATTVHTLVASGVRPDGLRPTDEVGAAAARAWARAEREIPWLGDPRENLWLDLDEVEHGSTSAARDLVDRVRAALDVAFGPVEGRRTVVHHGFYFYSPAQWAMFQVLRRVPGVDQVFVVHDDGRNPAFSTWRHYFRSDLWMPVPRGRSLLLPSPRPRPRRSASVLQGEGGYRAGRAAGDGVPEPGRPRPPVGRQGPGTGTDDEEDLTRYAAAAEQVERYVQRLGRTREVVAAAAVQLPVGSFLLAVHRCIVPRNGGRPEVRLDGNALLDVVASGYLDVAEELAVAPALVRRVLPYFSDCVSGDEWVARADLLGTRCP